MLKKLLINLMIFPVFFGVAQAAFVVDIYDTPSFRHTNQLRDFMDDHDAVGSYQYDVINFSDRGNRGFFGDENLWPIANKNTFSAHITGLFDISEAGSYDFATWSDDGIDLLIDGVQTIIRPNPHAPTLDVANLFLTAGLHSIDVIWYENWGAAVLELSSRRVDSNEWQLLEAAPFSANQENIPEPKVIWCLLIGLFLLTQQTTLNRSIILKNG